MRHFKLYPDNHWVWIDCWIWNTKEQMYAKAENKPFNYDAISKMGTYLHFKNDTMSGKIGDLHFYKASIGGGIVSHEIAHAVFGYLRLRKRLARMTVIPFEYKREPDYIFKTSVALSEEAFCLLAGNMNRQFWSRFHRQKKTCGQHTLYAFAPILKSLKKLRWPK